MKKTLPAEKAVLTYKEALELLSTYKEKGKLRIHTIELRGMIMGCNMDLSDVKRRMKKSNLISLANPTGHSMGHELFFHDEKIKGSLFLETDSKKINAIIKSRK